MRIHRISRWVYFGGCLLIAAVSCGKTAVTSAIPQAGFVPTPASAKVLAFFMDHSGKLLAAPYKGELVLKLGGEAVEVEEIQSLRNQPLIFSLVVDESGSTREIADIQTKAAIRLFRALSTGSNRGFLVEFSDLINASDQFVDASTVEQRLRKAPRSGSTKLYDALIAAATNQLQSSSVPPNSRRAIFAFTDGQDNTSMRSLPQALQILESAGTPVFPIKPVINSAWNLNSKRSDRQGAETLVWLSANTGGRVILPNNTNDLLDQMPRILEGQCLITFKTSGLMPNKGHSLKISVPGKDVQTLAQSEYVAP